MPRTKNSPEVRKVTKRSPKKAPKRGGVRITGPRYTPVSETELMRAYLASQREWNGDAWDVQTWTPCRVCGGAAGTSAEYVAPFRRHRACRGLSSPASRVMAAVAEVLGIDLSRDDAHLLAQHVQVPPYAEMPEAQPVPEGGRLPRAWGHIDRRKLKKAVANLPTLRAEAALVPVSCVAGACCWCGVRKAVGWSDHGHRWDDGSKAPLCGECAQVYERHHRSPVEAVYVADFSTQRRLAWHALTGTAPRLGVNPAPSGFRVFAEVAGDDRTGDEERGGYIAPPQRPGTPEYIARVEREQAEAEARREQRRAEQREAEQREAESWGFGATK